MMWMQKIKKIKYKALKVDQDALTLSNTYSNWNFMLKIPEKIIDMQPITHNFIDHHLQGRS